MQRLTWFILALVLLAAFAAPALAQPVGGLQGLPEKRQLTSEDRARIKQYVDQLIPGLSQGPLEVKRSRELLLRYLIEPKEISGDFRREYAGCLLATLQQVAKDRDDLRAANALRIAGEVATQSVVDLILESLRDERSSVRFAGAFAVARVFDAVRLYEPAVVPAKLLECVNRLADGVRNEQDPAVLDALVQAFDAGMKVPRDKVNDAAFGPSIISSAARALGTRAAALGTAPIPGPVVPVLLRGVTSLRNAATQAELNQRGLPATQRTDIRAMCESVLTGVAALRKSSDFRGATARDVDQLDAAAKALRDLLGN